MTSLFKSSLYGEKPNPSEPKIFSFHMKWHGTLVYITGLGKNLNTQMY